MPCVHEGSRAAQITEHSVLCSPMPHFPSDTHFLFHYHSQRLRRSTILVLENIGRESCTQHMTWAFLNSYTFLFFLCYSVFTIYTWLLFLNITQESSKEATNLGMCLTLLRCWQQEDFCVLAALPGYFIKLVRALSQLMHNWLVIHQEYTLVSANLLSTLNVQFLEGSVWWNNSLGFTSVTLNQVAV